MMSGSDSNPDDNCEVPKYILRLEEVPEETAGRTGG
jgi:hypothetical protein